MSLTSRLIVCLCPFILLSGCSIAPLNSPDNGRTLGEGQAEYAYAVNQLTIAHGVSEDVDIGLGVEVQFEAVYNVWVKKGFYYDEESGHALSGLAGIFYADDSGDSQGYYFGPSYSKKGDNWEFYTTLRYNHVYWNGLETVAEDDQDDLIDVFDREDEDFGYLQTSLGFQYHFADNYTFKLGAICLGTTPECMPVLGIAFRP